MLISELSIRNFKSYGNSKQTITLNDKKGSLILLQGTNGSGKSSLLAAFDYVLYGKCKGTVKKYSTQSTLINNINGGEMVLDIKFRNGNTEVQVERGLKPNFLRLTENGIIDDKSGESKIKEKIENYIGMDVDTFKSFISMTVNDFKNFMALPNEEKQMLLDKLFNLEIINILNQILKEMVKNNKQIISKYDTEITTFEDSIKSIRKSIEKALEQQRKNLQNDIDNIKQNIEANKEEYLSAKENVAKINDKLLEIKKKDNDLSEEIDKEKTELNKVLNNITNVEKEIKLYNSGKCPTCKVDFSGEFFINMKAELVDKLESITKIKIEIEKNIEIIKEKKTKLVKIHDETNKLLVDANSVFNDLTFLLKSYKSQIETLEAQKKLETNTNTEEFENTIKELSEKKEYSFNRQGECRDKELYYKELARVFGEDGVKKSIIGGIIKPINHFINENITRMELPFTVVLDETFNATVKKFGLEYEHDMLSVGQTKLINIAILFAYLKLIRTKRNINVLFLDEVFSGIAMENISKILSLLKSFAIEYNINIFVVHHATMDDYNFDRIISLEYNMFTTINEVKI